MAIRKDIEDLMATEVQRFRDELLTAEELEQIEKDVMAFCIIEIRKFCGQDIFERKNEELKAKGFDREKIKVKVNLHADTTKPKEELNELKKKLS
jgi:hypothetical protein